MKIIVKSKPNAKQEKVERIDAQQLLNFQNQPQDLPMYTVSVKEMPVNGNANKAIISALAKYFKVAPSLITLVSGQTSKIKTFEIDQ